MTYDQGTVIIGIDVGGTKIHGAAYGMAAPGSLPVVLCDRRVPTDLSRGFESVLEQVIEMVEAFRVQTSQQGSILSVGVGFPGLVDGKQGLFYGGGNVKVASPVPAKKILEDTLHVPVAIENDAGCFALAEYASMENKPAGTLIGLTVGTGLGSGLIINGSIYHGAMGFGAEIGATRFDELHTYEEVTASKADDATRGTNLGILVADLLRTFNPAVITFGGGIVEKHWDTLENEMVTVAQRLCPGPYWDGLQICASHLEHPATIGAALIGLNHLSP